MFTKLERQAFKKLKDSLKDSASLSDTIKALIDDEAAAVSAYDIALKNLQLTTIQRQLLTNIRDDELNHIENLNALLADNITEKNLQDKH